MSYTSISKLENARPVFPFPDHLFPYCFSFHFLPQVPKPHRSSNDSPLKCSRNPYFFSLDPHVPLVFNFLIIFPSLFSLNGVTCWTFFSFYNHAIAVPLAAASLQLFYFSKHFELRQTKDQVSHIHIKPRKTFIVLCM